MLLPRITPHPQHHLSQKHPRRGAPLCSRECLQQRRCPCMHASQRACTVPGALCALPSSPHPTPPHPTTHTHTHTLPPPQHALHGGGRHPGRPGGHHGAGQVGPRARCQLLHAGRGPAPLPASAPTSHPHRAWLARPLHPCRVRAIGSTLRLKQRFGSGYQLSVSVLPPHRLAAVEAARVEAAAEAVKSLFKVGEWVAGMGRQGRAAWPRPQLTRCSGCCRRQGGSRSP
jgi:hypothetical protein